MALAKPIDSRRPWMAVLLRLLHNPSGLMGLILIVLVIAISIFAPLIAPYDPIALNTPDRLQGPSGQHLAGTDQYGRDTLSRIIYGGRISLAVAFSAIALSVLVGSFFGLLAGYYRGWLDIVIMRFTDVLLSFPVILLAIALLAFFGSGFSSLVIAIAVVYVGPFTRVARAAVLAIREELYVEASRASGSSNMRTLFMTLLPNALAPLIIEVTLRLAYAILIEAGLSFLGLGTQPPAPSWGQMISENRRFLSLSPWATIAPGLAIMVIVLGFNLLGDGLRDALDPRLKG